MLIVGVRHRRLVVDGEAGALARVDERLRYSINVTLDGCCDHREMIADEDLHCHAMETSSKPMLFSLAGSITK
jgi:hypothetical protein